MFNSQWYLNKLGLHSCNAMVYTAVSFFLLNFYPIFENSWFTVLCSVQFSHSVVFFATPWTTACQASLSFTNSRSLLKLMSIVSVMPSNHLILCRPLFLLSSIFPSIRVFSSESVLHIRWPKYWSFSFSISPSGLISLRMDSFNLLAVQGLSRVFSKEGKTTIVSELWCKYNSVIYVVSRSLSL